MRVIQELLIIFCGMRQSLVEVLTKLVPACINTSNSTCHQRLLNHIYSDTCRGQNRNSHIAAMCFSVLQTSPTLQLIDHKFIVSGHSHLECDTAHAVIEKQNKKTSVDIHHPRDWSQLIHSMGKNILLWTCARKVYLISRNYIIKNCI